MSGGIRNRIRQRLDALGKTAQQASIEAGLSRDFLRTYFNRPEASPRVENLARIADVLGVSAQWLMTGIRADERDTETEPSGLIDERAVWNAVFALAERGVCGDHDPVRTADTIISLARWLTDHDNGDAGTTVIDYEVEKLKRSG